MWSLRAPAAVLGLAVLSCLPAVSAKPYPVHIEEFADLHNASQVEKRQCNGTPCGFYGQLCCTGNQQCFTDSNGQAQCGTGGGSVQQGEWQTFTTTWVDNGPVTHTSVYSTYVGLTAAAQPTGSCKSSQSPCGSLCCDSGFYCKADKSQCLFIGGSSGGIIVTATGSPTRTVPFETPIATGVNGSPEPVEGGGGGGLSGGAIAGIVIGVLIGVLLLFLLCLFCCAKSLFDTIMACFGLGKRKHTKETTYVESHHHSSHHGGAAGGWYGHGPSRPSRPHKESSNKFGNLLGIGAGLGALALALGMKRKHDKHDDKSTTISSSYYSDYYTSSSSASSDDRRTRNTRHSHSRR